MELPKVSDTVQEAGSSGAVPGPAGKKVPAEMTLVKKILIALIKARKVLLLYPETNPAVAPFLEECRKTLETYFQDNTSLELLVDKDQLFYGSDVIDLGESVLKDLALQLYLHVVKKVNFEATPRIEEIKDFLKSVNEKPEEAVEQGGITRLLHDKGVEKITVQLSKDVKVVDGEEVAEDLGQDEAEKDEEEPVVESLLDMWEESEAERDLESPGLLDQLVARISDGDSETRTKLLALTRDPEHFGEMLSALLLEDLKDESSDRRGKILDDLLLVLNCIGDAINYMSAPDRDQLFSNLAQVITSLTDEIKQDFLQEKVLPDLRLGSVRSNVLSQFPLEDIAKTLTTTVGLDGEEGEGLRGSLENLAISQQDMDTLIDLLKESLDKVDLYRQEFDELLQSFKSDFKGEPEIALDLDKGDDSLMGLSDVSPAEIQLSEDDRTSLDKMVSEELAEPFLSQSAHSLLDLLLQKEKSSHYEKVLQFLLARLETLISQNEHDLAAKVVLCVKSELANREPLSPTEMQAMEDIMACFGSRKSVNGLIAALDKCEKQTEDFDRIVSYLSLAGDSGFLCLFEKLRSIEARSTRLKICTALVKLGEAYVDFLGEKMVAEEWFVARNVVSILRQIGTGRAVEYVEKALVHEDPRVRKEALNALAVLKSNNASGLMISMLSDTDESVRKLAASWTGVLSDNSAVPALLAKLQDKETLNRDPEVAKAMIQSLGELCSEVALPVLEGIATKRVLWRRKKTAELRQIAAEAIEKIRSESCVIDRH